MFRVYIYIILLFLIISIFFTACNSKKNNTNQVSSGVSADETNTQSKKESKKEAEIKSYYKELKTRLQKNMIYPIEYSEDYKFFDFTLKDLKDNSVSLKDFKGKAIFLNFWATWCGPCKAEMPSMQKLYTELKNEGLVIVAINLREQKSTVEKFVKQQKITFPVLLDRTGEIGAIYGARGIPLSLLIDTNGYIVGAKNGTMQWNTDGIIEVFRFILDR